MTKKKLITVTITQAAAHLRISPSAVSQAIKAGRIVATKKNSRWGIDPAEVDRYDASRRERLAEGALTYNAARTTSRSVRSGQLERPQRVSRCAQQVGAAYSCRGEPGRAAGHHRGGRA